MTRGLALLAACLCIGLWHSAQRVDLNWAFAMSEVPSPSDAAPRVETVFDYTTTQGVAHAAALQFGRGAAENGFSIIWFEGTRESHNDVVIRKADLTKAGQSWTPEPPQTYLTKEAMSAVTTPRQTILTLGNTIQFGDSTDRVLATIVSLGGWAAASIAMVEMGVDGPQHVRKLSLSPFLNRSHLVRAPTLAYQDGTVAIPAYQELGNAFGLLVRLGPEGRVRDTRRLTQGRFGIQPMIVPLDAQSAVALIRNFDDETDRLIAAWTQNGGRSWSQPKLLDLPNPSAPVAALRLASGDLLMAYNDVLPGAPAGGGLLRLAVSGDQGETWQVTRTLEQGGGNARYPAMARLPDGDIVLTYSYGSKSSLKALVFNDAWASGG